jgi:hypothetical protein
MLVRRQADTPIRRHAHTPTRRDAHTPTRFLLAPSIDVTGGVDDVGCIGPYATGSFTEKN